MRVIQRIIAVIFLLGLGSLALANANQVPVVHPNSSQEQEKTACVPFKDAETKAKAAGWVTAELIGDAKAAWLAHFNSLPPVSNVNPAHIYVSRDDQSPNVAVIFVDNQGCIRDINEQDPDQFMSWATDPGI